MLPLGLQKKKKQGGAVDASQQGDGPDASTNSASTSTGGNSNIKAKVDKGEADRRCVRDEPWRRTCI